MPSNNEYLYGQKGPIIGISPKLIPKNMTNINKKCDLKNNNLAKSCTISEKLNVTIKEPDKPLKLYS